MKPAESPYVTDGRLTPYLPLAFAWTYSSFLVPRARQLGYALCIHGSMTRDLDLVACPWTYDAVPPFDLAQALCEEVGGAIDPHDIGNPTGKPHGRLAWRIHCGGGPYIDLSVMPRRGQRPTGERLSVVAKAEDAFTPHNEEADHA